MTLSCHLPDTFERARLKAPLMLPEKSEVVPSEFRCVSGPKLDLNFRLLFTGSRT